MFEFYAQISAPQAAPNAVMTTLIALTRMSRKQIRNFVTNSVWNEWAA